MKRKYGILLICLTLMLLLNGCSPETNAPAPRAKNPKLVNSSSVPTPLSNTEATKPGEEIPEEEPVLYFTVVLHLEGWEDGGNESKFRHHAEKLREYGSLFEKYSGIMTLESKEIIEGCIQWDDNVLLEMQQRGHAIGIHADSGGQPNSTPNRIKNKLVEMKVQLLQLGIQARFCSGVVSKSDWATASINAGMEAVTCMVNYGLWALTPSLRPDWFEPYENPAEGHTHYPLDVTDRLTPWLAKDGATWINNDPQGKLIIIPAGMSLNNAYEELSGEPIVVSEFTTDDIAAWEQELPRILDAVEPGRINTFYAVWSFGQALDMELLEDWLKVIDSYVQQGKIKWAGIPEMIDLYKEWLGR